MSLLSNMQELKSVFEGVRGCGRADGKGQIFAVSSPDSTVGTSFVARALAMIAASNPDPQTNVLLLDADLQNNAQSAAFFSHEYMSEYGQPQGPYDATFGQIPFWLITPQTADHGSQAGFVSLYMIMATSIAGKLAFTHFHWELVRPGQSVKIRQARAYWHTLRERYTYIIIDVPAFDRADLKHEICCEADSTILVCARKDANSGAIKALYTDLNNAGAHCAGLIINDVPMESGYSGGVL